jgi:hypothetical protein
MPKQKGGSPFTDSWFEMPFWILLFLIVVTLILLASFGIFNPKPPTPPSIRPTFIPGQTEHKPSFVINNAYMESLDSSYTFNAFFTANNWNSDYKLYARFVTDLNQITDFEKVKDPPRIFTYKIKSAKPPKTAYVEAYISYDDIPIGPTQKLDIDLTTLQVSQHSS